MRLFIIGFVLFLVSCKGKLYEELEVSSYTPKSVTIEGFDVPRLSPKAAESMKEWASFRNLTQTMVSLAPYETRNTEQILHNNPDTLLIYRRLSPKNEKIVLHNVYVDRDWRTLENPKDTIFRLQKIENVETTFVGWNAYLLKDVSYTFSVFFKNISMPKITLSFTNISDETAVSETFYLDSIFVPSQNVNRQILAMKDNWVELRLTFLPKSDDVYQIAIGAGEDTKPSNSSLFYRPTLQIRLKDLEKINQSATHIVQKQIDIKSSYNAIFFWLSQIQEETKHLLAENAFPKTIDTPIIKSRFDLFYTQVSELADNIRNNPDVYDDFVKEKIKHIQNTYKIIIERINKSYDGNLEQLMLQIMKEREFKFSETILITE